MTAEADAVLRPLGAAAEPAVGTRLRQDVLVVGFTLGVSFACWIAALRGTDLGKLSGYGLLSALPPVYFAGLAMLAVGFAYALSLKPLRPGLLAANVVALVVQLHATTAILYPSPRYSWVYKHLGVIDYIEANGQTHRWIDIYHNWPGFFAATAWLAEAAGVDPAALAPWAQLFFELAAVAAIVFAVRGVTQDPRRVWIAAWLFVVANWVGQDYLSPQAFAFVLSMVVLGLALRLPRRGEAAAGGMRPAAILAAGAVCSLGVIVSHQLSPIFLILDLAGLVVLTRRPSFKVLAVLVAAEVGWVALGWTFVSTHFAVFDVSSSLNDRGEAVAHPLPGVALGTQASQLSMTLVGLLAIAGFVRAWRAQLPVLVPAALATIPFPFVLVQRYGGEGPLRAYLFALPWLALLVAELFVPTDRKPRVRWLSLAAVSTVIAAGSLFGYFGQEALNRITPDDVAASRWFLDHAPPGAASVLLASNFPERVDANYVDHLDSPRVLVHEPGVAGPRFTRAALAALGQIVHENPDKETYVIVTPSQLQYLRVTGTAPPGAAEELIRYLARSPDYQVVFRSGTSEIFRYAR